MNKNIAPVTDCPPNNLCNECQRKEKEMDTPIKARYGAMSDAEIKALEESSKRPIDNDPLYMQLAERFEKLSNQHQNLLRDHRNLLNAYGKNLDSIDALKTFLKTREDNQDFTFKKYTESRLAAQNEERPEDIQMGTSVMGIGGETGEVIAAMFGIAIRGGTIQDLVKKNFYHGHDLDKEKIILELGDVLWYVMFLANAIGSSLETVALENELKLSKRYKNGFSIEEAKKLQTVKRIPGDLGYPDSLLSPVTDEPK